MRFSNIDEAVALVTLSGVGSFMAKMDVKSAFRLIPVRKQDWNLLGYCHDNRYYFDTVLPFGLRSSPAIFNRLSEFMKWMLITKALLVIGYITWTISLSFAQPKSSVKRP